MSNLIIKYGCCAWLMLMAWGLNAQLVNNKGAMVYTNAGCEVYVLGDGVANNSGTMENAGYWYIDGDMENGGLLTGFGQSTGVYEVKQNWLNNGAFQADQSEVVLSGGNQNIGGASVSSFYNLSLLGTGIKNQSVNAEVQNRLDLSSIELDTDEYEMYLSSTDPLAIARSTGFVSSQGNGRLSWNLNSGNSYRFPLGFHQSNSDLRPVVISPKSPNVFRTRLAEGAASDEGYDLTALNTTQICEVNREYFHYIEPTELGSADMGIYRNRTVDPEWNEIIQWRDVAWQNTQIPLQIPEGIYEIIAIENWSNFEDPIFNLASSEAPNVDLGADEYEINIGETLDLLAEYSGDEMTVQEVNWRPSNVEVGMLDLSISITPEQTTTYSIEIVNDLGCIAYDETRVRVKNKGLLLPTAFSPNGDGNNDYWRPIHPNMTFLEYGVYNRWGELIYSGQLDAPGWDGQYNNQKQEVGVYVFVAKYKLGVLDKTFMESGNITLIR